MTVVHPSTVALPHPSCFSEHLKCASQMFRAYTCRRHSLWHGLCGSVGHMQRDTHICMAVHMFVAVHTSMTARLLGDMPADGSADLNQHVDTHTVHSSIVNPSFITTHSPTAWLQCEFQNDDGLAELPVYATLVLYTSLPHFTPPSLTHFSLSILCAITLAFCNWRPSVWLV